MIGKKKIHTFHCDGSRGKGLENKANYLLAFNLSKFSVSYFAKNSIIYLTLTK
jgi:hypothetical protein